MIDEELARHIYGVHNKPELIKFARSARKHRIAYADMHHALRHLRFCAGQPAQDPDLDDRILVFGPARDGSALELAVIAQHSGVVIVIHAMRLRRRHISMYERGTS